MSISLSIDKDVQIVSAETDSDWHEIAVHTLLQNVRQKRPSINAYLGARYSRSADSVRDIAREVLSSDKDAGERLEVDPTMSKNLKVSLNGQGILSVLSHYLLHCNPSSEVGIDLVTKAEIEAVGETIFKSHNHHNQFVNIAQSGTYLIDDIGDLGTLKDLNRQRSLEPFVPLWNDHIDLSAELDRENDQMFSCVIIW